MSSPKFIARIAAAALLISTASCVAPEKGDVEILVDKTGGYTFSYHGSMAYLLGLAAKASGKPLKPKDVQGIADALQGLRKDHEFLSVTPAGFSRVTVDYKAVRKAGQSFKFIGDASVINIVANPKDHTLRIRSPVITAKDAAQLRRVGYAPDIAVTIKSELPVASTNGTKSAATIFGGTSYRWKIDYGQRAPIDMTLRLPS